MTHLRITSLADLVALEVLASESPLLRGELVEETSGERRLWWRVAPARWRLGSRLAPALPWTPGEPSGNVRRATDLAALRTLGIVDDPAARIDASVIVRTADEGVLAEILRTHVFLGQGDVAFASENASPPCWLIKIVKPSLWCLHRLPPSRAHRIYNEVGSTAGLYLERGTRLSAGETPLDLARSADTCVLLDRDASALVVQPAWRPARSAIRVDVTAAHEVDAHTDLSVTVCPKLVPAELRAHAALWRIPDHRALERVLEHASRDTLAGFRAWLTGDGAWIERQSELTADDLPARMSQTFASYRRLAKRLFLPRDMRILPPLDEPALLAVYGATGSDCVVLDAGAGGEVSGASLLRHADARPLADVVVYAAELAVREIETFASQWELDLGELAEAPLSAGDRARSRSAERAASPLAAQDVAVNRDTAPERGAYATSEADPLVEEIAALDEQLAREIDVPDLWRRRAEASAALGHARCSLVAALTAEIAAARSPRVAPLLAVLAATEDPLATASHRLDEEQQGALLARCRRDGLSAEEAYVLQICFAHRFRDADVFQAAVDAMRSGHADGRHPFYRFSDFDETRAERLAAAPRGDGPLPHGDAEHTLEAARAFVARLGTCDAGLRHVLLLQLGILLEANFGAGAHQALGLPLASPVPAGTSRALRRRAELLATRDGVDSAGLEKSTRAWLERVGMEGLDTAPVERLFAGEVYRAVLSETFLEQSKTRVQEIYDAYSAGAHGWSDAFAGADARPGTDELIDVARGQRLLLYLVTRYGPLRDFAMMIHPYRAPHGPSGRYEYLRAIVSCDAYRLSLMYDAPLDDAAFFEEMIAWLPRAGAVPYVDYRDATENLLMCLMLSRAPQRRAWLEQILDSILAWLARDDIRDAPLDELLGLVSYVQAGFVSGTVARATHAYRYYTKRKGLFMEHAHALASLGFDEWTTQAAR